MCALLEFTYYYSYVTKKNAYDVLVKITKRKKNVLFYKKTVTFKKISV